MKSSNPSVECSSTFSALQTTSRACSSKMSSLSTTVTSCLTKSKSSEISCSTWRLGLSMIAAQCWTYCFSSYGKLVRNGPVTSGKSSLAIIQLSSRHFNTTFWLLLTKLVWNRYSTTSWPKRCLASNLQSSAKAVFQANLVRKLLKHQPEPATKRKKRRKRTILQAIVQTRWMTFTTRCQEAASSTASHRAMKVTSACEDNTQMIHRWSETSQRSSIHQNAWSKTTRHCWMWRKRQHLTQSCLHLRSSISWTGFEWTWTSSRFPGSSWSCTTTVI